MQIRDDNLSPEPPLCRVLYAKLRWSKLAEARNCDFPFDKPTVPLLLPSLLPPTTTSIPTPTRRGGGGGSHHLSSWHRQSRSMTCEDRARSSTRVVMKKVNPTDNFVVSRILHYPIPFFALGSSAKRQSARAFVYCETRRGHTHFLPLPLLPGFLITPHKTFNEISEDGRVKIIKTF